MFFDLLRITWLFEFLVDVFTEQAINMKPPNGTLAEDSWINRRWPTRLFYGEKGELMHPYSRSQAPNLK